MIVLIGIIFISLIYLYIQISQYKINAVVLTSKKIGFEMKILQISDFHSNKHINLEKVKRDLLTINPDIVVLTGDLVNKKDENFTIALDFIRQVKMVSKEVFMVLGNHEVYNCKCNIFLTEVEKLGVKLLQNEIKTLNINESRINLIGINFDIRKDSYISLLTDVDNNYFNLVLSHSPYTVLNSLSYKENLILSGHTHGGQVRLPFLGAIICPSKGFFPKYSKGLYSLGKNNYLYIDSGIGYRALPIRILNRSQISLIKIQSSKHP